MSIGRTFWRTNELSNDILDINNDSVPLVYHLLVESVGLRGYLKDKSIFVGQWWKSLLENDDVSKWEKDYRSI